MSEIRDRDEFVLTVNRLMICAMEDIDCGRDEAGPTTLDLVKRIEDHEASLRAENAKLREALENIVDETTDVTALTIATDALARAAEASPSASDGGGGER